jgi:hypothetical protein
LDERYTLKGVFPNLLNIVLDKKTLVTEVLPLSSPIISFRKPLVGIKWVEWQKNCLPWLHQLIWGRIRIGLFGGHIEMGISLSALYIN